MITASPLAAFAALAGYQIIMFVVCKIRNLDVQILILFLPCLSVILCTTGGLVALDATVQNDPKYKKYAQQVEKCLASFETMNEWPDFISFLKQLLKVLIKPT